MPIRKEDAREGSTVLHNKVGIVPGSAQVKVGASFRGEVCEQPGTVIHGKIQGFVVGVQADVLFLKITGKHQAETLALGVHRLALPVTLGTPSCWLDDVGYMETKSSKSPDFA
jgi:hypothetical protein